MHSLKVLTASAILLVASTAGALSVEFAAERLSAQTTALPKWLQLFEAAGVTSVRVRGATAADRPALDDLGTPDRPLPKLVGVLDERGVLHLPGAERDERFTLRDGDRLRDYLQQLQADGGERLAAPKGRYGLTESEFEALFTALTPPLAAVAPAALQEGATLEAIVTAVNRHVGVAVDDAARAPLAAAAEGAEQVAPLSVGTALALLLRSEGLALAAEKPPGAAPRLRVVEALGAKEPWPAGHKPERSPRETAPALFESLTVEVDGYTLREAIDALAPRLRHGGAPLPVVWDRFALRAAGIDPAQAAVTLPRVKTYYKRVIDRLVIQAHLRAELRVDESGQPLVVIGR